MLTLFKALLIGQSWYIIWNRVILFHKGTFATACYAESE